MFTLARKMDAALRFENKNSMALTDDELAKLYSKFQVAISSKTKINQTEFKL